MTLQKNTLKTAVTWRAGMYPEQAGWYYVAVASNDPVPQWIYELLWYNPDSVVGWWQHEHHYPHRDNIKWYCFPPCLPVEVQPR